MKTLTSLGFKGFEGFKGSKELKGLKMCAPHYIMMYWLQKYHEETDSKLRNTYIHYYESTAAIIEIAEDIMNQLKITIESSEAIGKKATHDMKSFWELYRGLPFFLTSNTYGSYNWKPDYIDFIKNSTYRVNKIPKKGQEIIRPDFGFYPANAKQMPKFNIKDSIPFEIDGKKRIKPFEPLSLDVKVHSY
jgi:hypothetical protein